jgi:hypothetical protein
MFIWIVLDAFFRKADVASRRLAAEPPKSPVESFVGVRSASRKVSRG